MKSEFKTLYCFRKYFMLFSVIITSVVFANNQGADFYGEMECTVTGNVVAASEEGKFKQYSGIKDGVKTGDNLRLEYRFATHGTYIGLKRRNVEKEIVINAYIGKKNSGYKVDRSKNGLILEDYLTAISFLDDYIRIQWIDSQLYLSRYYKNDWHGIYASVRGPELFTHTIAINCRHTIDKIDEIFKLYSK